MTSILTAGNQFLVNTTTTGQQSQSAVTRLNNGEFVVTWQSVGQDGSIGGIYAQRYSSAGVAIGGELLINPVNPYNQEEPAITALSTGGYVVTWTSQGQDSTNATNPGFGYGQGIYCQRVDQFGALIGGEILVNTTVIDDQNNSSVSSLPGGGFVVAWNIYVDAMFQGYNAGVAFQRFDANGAKVGAEIILSIPGATPSNGTNVSVATFTSGDFIVVWSAYTPSSGYEIYSQRYTSAGVPIDANPVSVSTGNLTQQIESSVTVLANGEYVIAWKSIDVFNTPNDVAFQRYSSAGVAVGGEISVVSALGVYDVTVTALSNGGFAVTYFQSNTGLFVQRYDNNGVALGTVMTVSSTTQYGGGISVSATTNGGFVVAWASGDGSNNGIYAKQFNTASLGSDLQAGIEYADGTAIAETINVGVNGLNAGDHVFGYAGHDILRFTGGGVNTAVGALLNSIEEIQLTNSVGTTLTVNDVSQAMLVTSATGASDALIMQTGTFTVAQRRALFDLGVESLTDAQGTFLSTNAAPVVVVDNAATGEDATITINVVQNDSDANGDALTVIAGSLAVTAFAPGGGLVLPVAGGPSVTNAMLLSHFTSLGGTIQFTPDGLGTGDFNFLDAGQTITITLAYNVTDGVANVVPATLTLTINGANEIVVLSNVADNHTGTAFGDNVTGNAGDDTILAMSGNDTVYGGTGDDTLHGGDGADKIYGEADDDALNGGSGIDLVYGGAGDDVVAGGSGNDQLWGGADADAYVGGSGIDYARYDDANWGNLTLRLDNSTLNVGAAANGDTYSSIEALVGGLGNDVIIGNALANQLFGGGGNDYIDGLAGNDFLNGGAGADKFRFSTTLSATNVDNVADFVHGTDDLLLAQSIFTGIGTVLDVSELRLGTAAVDPNDFVIYNSATGQLFYDANGNGAGGQTLFASVTAGTVLDAADFMMV